MKRLEVIHLRWTGPCHDDILVAIRETIVGLGARSRVQMYRHAGVPTDLGIFLHHDTEQVDPQMIALGARLAAALKEMGMVEHSIWIEQED